MQILKVHNFYLQPGGEDTVFKAETNLLRKNGHEVIQYLEFNQRIASMNQAAVALQTIWSVPSSRRMRAALKKEKPDIVHFHNTFPLISPSAYYVCQEFGIPVVQTLDNQRLICPAATFYRDGKLCVDCLGKTPPWPGVLHACYHDSHLHTAVAASLLTVHRLLHTWQKKVDIFLSSTRFYRDLFVKAGLPADKIRILPHFVSEVSVDSSVRPEGGYALFIGRLDAEKGIRTLLEAWRHVDIPLKIRGGGQLENEARGFVRAHGMQHVQFLPRMEDNELSKLIQNARFLIVPSEGFYETFGLVIIEAYARGVPVLASNIGVIPELVNNQETGLLFEPGNPLDLADKAHWLWDQPGEAERIGKNAYLEYKQKYTTDRVYQLLLDIYNQAILNKGG